MEYNTLIKPLSLSELKEIAEEAKCSGKGIWEHGVNADPPFPYAIMDWTLQPHQEVVADGIENEKIARYISAFDPKTILMILSSLDVVQEIIDEMRREGAAAESIWNQRPVKDESEPMSVAYPEALGFSKATQKFADKLQILLGRLSIGKV